MIALQVLVSGLGLSGYYALVALGFALIFATVRVFHVAHGTVFLAGGYLFYLLHHTLGVNLVLAALVGIGLAAVFGLLIDQLVYLPVLRRGGGLFSVFIASLGVSLVFESCYILFSKNVLEVARVEPLTILTYGAIAIRVLDLVIAVIVAVIFGLVYLWLYRSTAGLEIRALTDNPALADVVGVDVGWTRNLVFLVASALAGLAGVITTYDTGIVPDTGLRVLFIAVVAVIAGGVQNLMLGTLVGSLALGLLTAFAGLLFPPWVSVAVFLALILLIVARPKGLFAR
jgi:branched-chain amino acid transport system permease protein